MAKTIQFRAPIQENEARLVAGIADKGRRTQYELYAYCSDYFWDNYRGVFFADDNAAAEILQNTFIAFWENIERRKIYVEDGIVMGKDNKPLNGSILTYFMSIARNKYLEYGREHPVYADPETELGRLLRAEGFDPNDYIDMLYDSGENLMLDIIADVISHMSPRCSQILTYFMSIARNKYLEYGREHPVYADPETELGRLLRAEGFDPNDYIDMLYDSGENLMLDIIADVISHMSPRCSQILTKFYYEEKKLETILKEMPTIESYNALKTKKNKCMNSLRKSAREIYKRKLNS